MAKRLNRFTKDDVILNDVPPIELKETIEPLNTLDDTTELSAFDIDTIDSFNTPQENDTENLKHKISFKMTLVFLMILIIFALCGGIAYFILTSPTESHIESSYVKEIVYSDEDKQKMLESINTYLSDIYGDKYEKASVSDLNVTETEGIIEISDFYVHLTSADNSPTLTTNFELNFNSETNDYSVTSYIITDAIYPD